MIAGRELDPYGIASIDSVLFDYDDPGKELTFHWFKHNIMCKDNAWICEEKKKGKKEKEETKKSRPASSGNKKAQRKKQSENGKRNKGKQDLRRRRRF